MKCVVVTPEKTEVDTKAAFVAIPLFDGEYGVAPLHTPMVGRLGAGELRLTKPSDPDHKGSELVDRYFIEGGFVEVNSDVVSIMTNRLLRTSDVTVESAEATFNEIQNRSATTFDAVSEKQNALRSARALVRTARKWNAAH